MAAWFGFVLAGASALGMGYLEKLDWFAEAISVAFAASLFFAICANEGQA
jgi:hypothetical protein